MLILPRIAIARLLEILFLGLSVSKKIDQETFQDAVRDKPLKVNPSFRPTDYSNRDNWMHYDYNNPLKKDTKADVIFFYGTSIAQPDQENGVALISDTMKEMATKMTDECNVFDDALKLYIPFYRQISLATAIELDGHSAFLNRIQQSEVATDVSSALDYYFQNCNEGRPFILAGFSQGAACIQVALEQYFGDPLHRDYLNRMVAAYSIGYGVDRRWLEGISYLKFAEKADDTGVVLSWNTEGPGEKGPSLLLADSPEDTLVINPINWKTDETYASAGECLGSLTDEGMVKPGKYNLQIDKKRGSLICDNNTNYVVLPDVENFWGGKSLHTFEINEVFLNIRQNVRDRVDAFLKANAQ